MNSINDDDIFQSTSVHYDLSRNLEKLSIETPNAANKKLDNGQPQDSWNLPSTTSVKEMSNCAPSCSHEM